MQKISFGSKDYVKASVIAKRFRYTQDYVGQLCRAKKVDARLVGRTWYVEPDSVVAYRKQKHATQKGSSVKVAFNKTSKRNLNPKSVAPVLRSKTLKATGSTSGTAKPEMSVKYSSDAEVSIPILEQKPDRAVVNLSVTAKETAASKPAKKIKLKKSKSSKTKFSTEKLPEISLSGNVEVKELDDQDGVQNTEPAAPDKTESKRDHPINPTHTSRTAERPSVTEHQTAVTQADRRASTSSKAPATVQQRFDFLYSDRFLLVSVLVGVCSALAILSLATLGEISPSTSNSWSLFFNLQQLLNLVG